MSKCATASQTVGPYFSIGMSRLNSVALCSEAAAGEHIEIFGQVFDGNGLVVPDAQLEVWQADSRGRFAELDPAAFGQDGERFAGFGRIPTDERGGFRFHTVHPGRVPCLDGTAQAPHIVVLLSMRGLLKHLFTRIYFEDDPDLSTDPILKAVPEERRETLYARAVKDKAGQFLWNIHLQGEHETVFFDY